MTLVHTAHITEQEFQTQVLDLAKVLGWKIYHTRDSRGSNPGWPDLVLCKPPRCLFVELKRDSGKLSPAQQEWLTALTGCGLTTRVWRPRNFLDMQHTLEAPIE